MTIGQLERRFAPELHNSRDDVIANARWVASEIPVRLAHRLRDFHRLPYLALSSESLAQVHTTYLESFDKLSSFPEIQTVADADDFCTDLRTALRMHKDVVLRMKVGVAELRSFDGLQSVLSSFLDKLFVTRIGNRVLAEHFLAWREQSRSDGIVTDCKLADVVGAVARDCERLVFQIYGICPEIRFEGKLDTSLPTIPEHVEYITREIIKNALRATVEHNRTGELPPVVVGVFLGKFDVLIKVSDRGGGFDRKVARRIWEYGFTTARDLTKEKAKPGTSVMEGTPQEQQKLQVAGFGVGLPLSRLYARYFGGDVHLSQMLLKDCSRSVLFSCETFAQGLRSASSPSRSGGGRA
jgi:hypothetical protein